MSACGSAVTRNLSRVALRSIFLLLSGSATHPDRSVQNGSDRWGKEVRLEQKGWGAYGPGVIVGLVVAATFFLALREVVRLRWWAYRIGVDGNVGLTIC